MPPGKRKDCNRRESPGKKRSREAEKEESNDDPSKDIQPKRHHLRHITTNRAVDYNVQEHSDEEETGYTAEKNKVTAVVTPPKRQKRSLFHESSDEEVEFNSDLDSKPRAKSKSGTIQETTKTSATQDSSSSSETASSTSTPCSSSSETDEEKEPSNVAKATKARHNFYCCPVCYVESYRRLDSNIRPNDDVQDDENVVDEREKGCFDDLETSAFNFNPMEVLQCADHSLELASAFCFDNLANLKRHLREDHSIDHKLDIVKNDMFHRFHMSQTDGLVQRWRKKAENMQGLGYKQDYFCQVKDELQMLRVGMCQSRRWRRQLRDCACGNPDIQDFRDHIQTFWSSFTIRGHRIWRALQQAYDRDNNEGNSSSGEEEDIGIGGAQDAINHSLVDRQEVNEEDEQAEDLKFVEELKRKHNLPEEESEGSGDELVDSDEEEQTEKEFGQEKLEDAEASESTSSEDDAQAPALVDCGSEQEEEIHLSHRGKQKQSHGNVLPDDDGD